MLCLALAGCGTNLQALMDEQNRLDWQVAEVLADDSGRPPGLDQRLLEAETAKIDACEPLYSSVMQRVDRSYEADGLSFGERFFADLQVLGALLVPIPSIENCAAAQEEFAQSYQSFEQQRNALGQAPLERPELVRASASAATQ